MTPIQININGRWILESVPELHELLKRPLRDGLGVFETMRMVDGMIPLLPRHYQRIRHSVTAWDYPLPDLPVPQSILSELKTQLAESPHLSSAKVRWGVIFQSGQLQQHSEFPLPCRFLEVIPGPAFAHFDATPLKLGVYTEKRKQSSTKAKHKLLHESVYEDAFTFAVSQGWDEAIVLNPTGQVIESANSNLFVWDGTCLKTPPLSEGCVEGVYRGLVIETCKAAGIRVEESVLEVETLEHALEIILCNALRGVRGVTHYAEKQYSTEFSAKLFALCRSAETL